MALLETFGWAMLPPVRPEAIGPRTRAGPDEVQIYRTRGVYRDRESRGKRSTWRPTLRTEVACLGQSSMSDGLDLT